MASEAERRAAAAARKQAQTQQAQAALERQRQEYRVRVFPDLIARQGLRVRTAEKRLKHLRDEQAQLIQEARGYGMQWDMIAKLSKLTRQACQQRLDSLVKRSE